MDSTNITPMIGLIGVILIVQYIYAERKIGLGYLSHPQQTEFPCLSGQKRADILTSFSVHDGYPK